MAFNIRVYGIVIKDNHILLSDETVYGKYYTKFPGGGLELGEGTRDCIKREFMEEMNWNVEAGEHLYTTDFYQQSAFYPEDQVISIYYMVNPLEDKEIQFSEEAAFYEMENYRWANLKTITEDSVTLPIDKIVIRVLKDKIK